MPTEVKARKIDELVQKLTESSGVVLLDYRGLNVAAISDLRRRLDKENVEFHVTKNTLLRIAAQRAEIEITPDLLEGPTAIAFAGQDESAPARLLTEFVRRNRVVSVKGGLVGGRPINAEQVERVAELPSRDILLAQLLGAFQAPMAKTLGVLQAPGREMAGLLQALAEKRQAEAA
ncbi:MAG: 50S ribosomal protein L10 [Chloroflexota bacterium]